MADYKVKTKVEQEIKPIKELCEKITTITKAELDKGIENIDAKELGEVVDMIKDLAEAKKEMVEACYKMQIMEAMEEAEYGEDYDEYGRIKHYRPMKMYTPIEEYYPYHDYKYPMRDIDKEYGKMYYGGGPGMSGNTSDMAGARNYSNGYESYNVNMSSKPIEIRDRREGKSPLSRKMYMEAKELHKGKDTQMMELEKYIQELSQDITEMIEEASPEEKQVLQQKISTLATKIK